MSWSRTGSPRPLLATLDAAQRSLDAGHLNAACSQLRAFGRQVESFSGRSLAVADANQLRTFNVRVQGSIGCS